MNSASQFRNTGRTILAAINSGLDLRFSRDLEADCLVVIASRRGQHEIVERRITHEILVASKVDPLAIEIASLMDSLR